MNLFRVTAFYTTGLLLAPFLYDHELYRIIFFFAAALALLTLKQKIFPLFMAIFLFSFGLSQYFLATTPRPGNSKLLQGARTKPVQIEGIIDSTNSRPDRGLTVDLASCRLRGPEGWAGLEGNIRIFIETNDAELLPGDRIRMLSRLKTPRNFLTPGAFDYERYLRRRDIVASGFALKASDLARLRPDSNMNPNHKIRTWRARIRTLVNESVPTGMAPFINALAIGDRGSMKREQRQLLSHSGLAHIFAISGLHLGLVASLFYLVGRSIYLRTCAVRLGIPPRRFLPLLILPLLAGYLILTGSAVSTLRALLMLTGAAVLCAISRRSRPLDILTAAVFLILLIDPLTLFEPSFQLSVAGAGGIVFFWPLWRPYIQKRTVFVRYVSGLLAVTLSATLATLPFVLLHFNTLAPAAIPLNLLAVPLVSFVLVPMILAAVLSSIFSTTTGAVLFQASAAILESFFSLTRELISLEPFSARILFIHPLHLLATIVLIVFLCQLRVSTRRAKIVSMSVILMLALAPELIATDRGAMNLVALDVGQGEALVLQTPDSRNILIDGGGLYSKRFDTGERLVAPALSHLGIGKLDAVILTHNHPDHRRGLAYILEHFPTEAFWYASPEKGISHKLSEILARKNIPIRHFEPGWHSLDSADAPLSLYVPANDSSRLNDHSLILYARHGHDGLLLTGDLEQAGIRELVKAEEPGPVTLLKIPHHGSRKSDPAPLVEKFSPRLAFVSVGYGNHYGLPDNSVIEKLSAEQVSLKRTDQDGSLIFTSRGRGWAIRHWKKGLFR